jgi:hypothetical protein
LMKTKIKKYCILIKSQIDVGLIYLNTNLLQR